MGVSWPGSTWQFRGIALLHGCYTSLVHAVMHQARDWLEECQCEDGNAEFRVWIVPQAEGPIAEGAGEVDPHPRRDDVDEVGDRLEKRMDADDPGRFDSGAY